MEVYAMNSFISSLKENKKLIIFTLIVIAIIIGVAIYNTLKPTPQHDPEINEYNDVNYIKKNYKDALRTLYENGRISAVDPNTGKPPRKGTFSDKMRITL